MPNSNNPPDVELGLTRAEAEFMLENCETNIAQGMAILTIDGFSRDALEKTVALIEQFKPIREKLKKAMR